MTASATGKVFGIDSFNKSTVCRNIKAMEGLYESINTCSPASGDDAKMQADESLVALVPEIFRCCPSTEALKEMLGGNTAPVPECVKPTRRPVYTLNAIPHEYSDVIVEAASAGARCRGRRKRPPCPYRPSDKRVQRPLRFTDSAKIGHIRKEFITVCISIVVRRSIPTIAAIRKPPLRIRLSR